MWKYYTTKEVILKTDQGNDSPNPKYLFRGELEPVSDPGEGPGWTPPPSPLIFRPNWCPKGRKKFFRERVPLPPLSQELGSISLPHGIKKNPHLADHFSGIIAYSKISTLKSGFKKLRIRMPVSPDTCGRKFESGEKKLRIPKHSDTCGRDLSVGQTLCRKKVRVNR